MRRLALVLLCCVFVPPAFGTTHLSQAQSKELTLALIKEVEVKIGEGRKDIALMMCVAARELVLRKFPRPPDDLVTVIKTSCQPLFEAVKVAPESAKVALEKYNDQISEMSFMMTVGPLGGGYDGSRKDIERMIAASKMEEEAIKLGTDFVALLPRPAQDEEVSNAGVDVSQLQVRRLELFDLIWGASFAKEMITQTVVPQLTEQVKKGAGAVSGKDRMTLLLVQSDVADATDLLQKAVPDSPESKEAEAVLKKIRERIDELYKKEVEKQRMPGDRYKGGDRSSLEAITKKALLREHKKVLRIVINGEGWTTPETIAWWDDNRALHWSRTKSLNEGYAAVETKESGLGQYRMVSFSFSQNWDWGTNNFLPTRVSVGGWGPAIMKNNVNK